MPGTPEWNGKAPCRGRAHFLWYPPMESKDPNAWYEMGRVMCSTCPVWEDCLEYGQGERWGKWGGLTPKERKKPSTTHGSWIDFRRGCRCPVCFAAHDDQMAEEPIDPDLLPDQTVPVYGDPSRLLYDITS